MGFEGRRLDFPVLFGRFEPTLRGPQPCTRFSRSVRYQAAWSWTPLRYGGHRGTDRWFAHINLSKEKTSTNVQELTSRPKSIDFSKEQCLSLFAAECERSW